MSTAPSQFVFRAMKPDGGTRIGVRTASGESHLAEELRRDNLLLLRAWRLPLRAEATLKWSLKDEVNLNDQLSILLARGVPLVEAMEVCASVMSPGAKPRVERMRELIAAGSSFAEACEKIGGFDPVTIAVYRSSERTGDLAGAARRLAIAAKRRQAILGKAITVMIYPAVVTTLAALIFFGLLTFLVPMIARQIEQMESEVNAYSALVFAVGIWMNTHLTQVLIIIMLLLVAAVILRRSVISGFFSLARRFPALARLMLTIEMARFFSVAGAMTKSGVPLADALGASTGVISDPRLRSQLERLRKDLVEGGVLRVLLDRVDALPLATRRLLIAAERGGDLDSAFDVLAEDLAAEVDTRSARLLALLEPMIIVLMFVAVGPLIIAIAIPLTTVRTPGL